MEPRRGVAGVALLVPLLTLLLHLPSLCHGNFDTRRQVGDQQLPAGPRPKAMQLQEQIRAKEITRSPIPENIKESESREPQGPAHETRIRRDVQSTRSRVRQQRGERRDTDLNTRRSRTMARLGRQHLDQNTGSIYRNDIRGGRSTEMSRVNPVRRQREISDVRRKLIASSANHTESEQWRTHHDSLTRSRSVRASYSIRSKMRRLNTRRPLFQRSNEERWELGQRRVGNSEKTTDRRSSSRREHTAGVLSHTRSGSKQRGNRIFDSQADRRVRARSGDKSIQRSRRSAYSKRPDLISMEMRGVVRNNRNSVDRRAVEARRMVRHQVSVESRDKQVNSDGRQGEINLGTERRRRKTSRDASSRSVERQVEVDRRTQINHDAIRLAGDSGHRKREDRWRVITDVHVNTERTRRGAKTEKNTRNIVPDVKESKKSRRNDVRNVKQSRTSARHAARDVEQFRRSARNYVRDVEQQPRRYPTNDGRDLEEYRRFARNVARDVEQPRRSFRNDPHEVEQSSRSTRNAVRGVEHSRRFVTNAVRNVEQSRRSARNAVRNVEQSRRSARNAVRGVEQSRRPARNADRDVEHSRQSARNAVRNVEESRRFATNAVRDVVQSRTSARNPVWDGVQSKSARSDLRGVEQFRRSARNAVRDVEQSRRSARNAVRDVEQSRRSARNAARDVKQSGRSARNDVHDVERSRRSARNVVRDVEQSRKSARHVGRDVEQSRRSARNADRNVEQSRRSVRNYVHDVERSRRSARNVVRDVEQSRRSARNADRNVEQSRRSVRNDAHDVEQSRRSARNVGRDVEQSRRSARNVGRDVEQRRSARNVRDVEQSRRSARNVVRDVEQPRRSARNVDRDVEQSRRSTRNVVRDVEQSRRSARNVDRDVEQSRRSARNVVRDVEQSRRSARNVVRDMEQSRRSARNVVRDVEQSRRSVRNAARDVEHTRRSARQAARGVERSSRFTRNAVHDVEHSRRSARNDVLHIQRSSRSTDNDMRAMGQSSRHTRQGIRNLEQVRRSTRTAGRIRRDMGKGPLTTRRSRASMGDVTRRQVMSRNTPTVVTVEETEARRVGQDVLNLLASRRARVQASFRKDATQSRRTADAGLVRIHRNRRLADGRRSVDIERRLSAVRINRKHRQNTIPSISSNIDLLTKTLASDFNRHARVPVIQKERLTQGRRVREVRRRPLNTQVRLNWRRSPLSSGRDAGDFQQRVRVAKGADERSPPPEAGSRLNRQSRAPDHERFFTSKINRHSGNRLTKVSVAPRERSVRIGEVLSDAPYEQTDVEQVSSKGNNLLPREEQTSVAVNPKAHQTNSPLLSWIEGVAVFLGLDIDGFMSNLNGGMKIKRAPAFFDMVRIGSSH